MSDHEWPEEVIAAAADSLGVWANRPDTGDWDEAALVVLTTAFSVVGEDGRPSILDAWLRSVSVCPKCGTDHDGYPEGS